MKMICRTCSALTLTAAAALLTSWQVLEFIRGRAGLNLVGMNVVEVSPPYDASEITAIAAATVRMTGCVFCQQQRAS